MQKTTIRIDYDGNWKIISTNLIEDFIAFFLPFLYDDVDFSVEPEFLEQELLETLKVSKRKKILDKLVKLRLKSGEEKWIFVHIEFQTDGNISERMFVYYRRILDKYGKEITAIVVYTGKNVPKKFDRYEKETYGTRLLYQFNTFCIRNQSEEELLKNPNPFAIVVLANLYTINTTNDLKKRLLFKEKLFELAYERNYPLEKTHELFIFVKELMQLDESLEKEYDDFVIKHKKMTI